jgi:23S rRNA pseudouridine2605 synthase
MSEERLQKILARAGIASRRKAEELIREGLVTVNGRVAGLGDKADPERDAVKVSGKRVQPIHEHRYLLLNKPRGFMSTVSDPEGRKTVIDLVPPGMRKALVPVGRLDYNTEGLLLLTDDGEFAQRIAHPRYGSTKTYEVKVKGLPSEAQLERLRAGIVLDDGQRTAPAEIRSRTPFKPAGARRRGEAESENSWWIVELTEGRTRQIREMFLRVGHPVQKLRRIAIGPLRDPHLPLGAMRDLTEPEIHKLLKSAQPRETPARKKPARKKPAVANKKEDGAKPAKRPVAKRAAAKPRNPRRPVTGVKRAGARKPASRKPASRKPGAKKTGPRGGSRGRQGRR